jgi:membrane-associated HD superfamily phosphohydrolase
MRLPTVAQLRYHGSRWAWVAGLAILAYLAFPSSATVAPLLPAGAVADRDVIAPFTFPVNKSDQDLAREAEELAATVKPIYQFQDRAVDSAKTAMHALVSSLEAAADAGGAVAIQQAAKVRGVPLSPAEAAYLGKAGRRHRLETALGELFDRTLTLGVTGPGVLQVEQAPELIVRRRSGEQSVARDQILSYAQYLQRARAIHPDKGSSVGDALYVRLAGHFFRPTLIPNTLETERRRDELRRSVDPSKYIVRAGDRIVGAHEVVTNEAHEKLVALHTDLVRRGAATSRSAGGVFGPVLRDGLIFAIFWVLLVFYRRETYRDRRQVALIGSLFALVLVQAAVTARLVPQHAEIIILPFLAMTLTVLFNGRVSMIAAMILAIVIGQQPVFHDQPALFLCVIGGVTAALSVRGLRRRSNFYGPVVIIALGYLAAALALGLAGSWSVGEIGARGLWGAVNGLVSAGLTFFLLPVAEALTGITTDLTLLELSDPSRPLLRRLSLEARTGCSAGWGATTTTSARSRTRSTSSKTRRAATTRTTGSRRTNRRRSSRRTSPTASPWPTRRGFPSPWRRSSPSITARPRSRISSTGRRRAATAAQPRRPTSPIPGPSRTRPKRRSRCSPTRWRPPCACSRT